MRSGRTISANELQTTGRRRRRTGSRAVVLVMAFVFAVLLFYVRDIKMRLKEVQETLQEIVSVQNGGMGAEGGEVPPASSFAGGEGSGIGAAVSGLAGRTGDEGAALDADGDAAGTKRPVERTLEEALQRLEVLGEKNEVIAEICVQSGRFHEKLLLALANNPEMADFVAGYPDSIYEDTFATAALSDDEREKECPLLLQWDTRWGYQPYGDMNIGLSGCGPTCLSMALYALTRDEGEMPGRIAKYAMDNGYYVQGTGTAWALMTAYPRLRGVNVREMQMDESALKTALDRNQILICAMGPGDFTLSGHFVVIYGYDGQGFFVNDPNCIARSRQKWPFATLNGQIKNIWAYWT